MALIFFLAIVLFAIVVIHVANVYVKIIVVIEFMYCQKFRVLNQF
jgi:hypothetical protein